MQNCKTTTTRCLLLQKYHIIWSIYISFCGSRCRQSVTIMTFHNSFPTCYCYQLMNKNCYLIILFGMISKTAGFVSFQHNKNVQNENHIIFAICWIDKCYHFQCLEQFELLQTDWWYNTRDADGKMVWRHSILVISYKLYDITHSVPFKISDKFSKIECENSDSLWCLQFRCQKYHEHKMSKLGVNDINPSHLCDNWISLNLFLLEWFIPAMRSVWYIRSTMIVHQPWNVTAQATLKITNNIFFESPEK